MKKLFLVTLVLMVLVTNYVSARADMLISVGEPQEWSYIMLKNENDSMADIENVVIFLHGNGRNTHCNNPDYIVEDLGGGYGPVFYEKWNRNLIPDNTIIVCPEAHADVSNPCAPDFLSRTDELAEFIEGVHAYYPLANLYVVGHSNGACATYKLCAQYPDIAKKWVFLSGCKRGEASIPDVLMMVVATTQEAGIGVGYDTMSDFQNFFNSTLPTRKTGGIVVDKTGNAFAMLDCCHGETPSIMLDAAFWNWLLT